MADQLTLVLSDIGFDKFGALEPAESGGPAGQVFGREGQYVLVNGKRKPTIRMRAGAPQRWRIVNTAKSRFFLLDMDGQPFTTIGVDGGLQEEPVDEQHAAHHDGRARGRDPRAHRQARQHGGDARDALQPWLRQRASTATSRSC